MDLKVDLDLWNGGVRALAVEYVKGWTVVVVTAVEAVVEEFRATLAVVTFESQ